MTLLEYVNEARGRTSRLAQDLGVSPVLISQWSNGVRPVPVERCVPIERATGRAVTCEELRPDMASQFAYLRGLAADPVN